MAAELLGRSRRRGATGFTLVELVMVCALLSILATIAIPAVKYTAKRSKEADLRQSLRLMRNALDEYKRYSDAGLIAVEVDTQGYPKELKKLVEGVDLIGQVDKKIKFLRRIPIDPMTGKDEWGTRSYQDAPDSTATGGENIYDVYSKSSGTGLNDVPYSKW